MRSSLSGRRRFGAFALVLGALMSVTMVGTTTGSASAEDYTRAERVARADALMKMDLYKFNQIAHQAKENGKYAKPIDKTLDWSNDECSMPGYDFQGTMEAWAGAFRNACIRHDFGYRNYGKNYYAKNLALRPSNDQKLVIDKRFYADMKRTCSGSGDSGSCNSTAKSFYVAVRSEKGENAYHGSECTPGKLCLFEDEGYKDKRWMFSQSHGSMADFKFSDQADSVKNTDTVAWALYEDENYQDTRVCIAAGAYLSSLDAKKIGDNVDSIRRLTTKTCS